VQTQTPSEYQRRKWRSPSEPHHNPKTPTKSIKLTKSTRSSPRGVIPRGQPDQQPKQPQNCSNQLAFGSNGTAHTYALVQSTLNGHRLPVQQSPNPEVEMVEGVQERITYGQNEEGSHNRPFRFGKQATLIQQQEWGSTEQVRSRTEADSAQQQLAAPQSGIRPMLDLNRSQGSKSWSVGVVSTSERNDQD
jgi:hypothetical protein